MPTAYGRLVDNQTRCEHWHGPTDVIAIKFKCCGKYYGCHECHSEMEPHEARTWPADEFDETAVLCGVCRAELSVAEYLACNYTCPSCNAAFNPGCANHYHLYFSMPG